jgi:clan AA aspartic protease
MITGVVTADQEAVVHLLVRGPQQHEVELEAIIDTGYTGALTLPQHVIEALGLPFRGYGRALLADGSERLFASYEAIVEWDGQLRRMMVDAAEADPLLGMTLLQGDELTMQVITGGSVTIQAL